MFWTPRSISNSITSPHTAVTATWSLVFMAGTGSVTMEGHTHVVFRFYYISSVPTCCLPCFDPFGYDYIITINPLIMLVDGNVIEPIPPLIS